MGLLSGATGAGLGGFFTAVGTGVTESENWKRKTAWEEAKMERMWGYEKEKARMIADFRAIIITHNRLLDDLESEKDAE